jgi:predicted nuclease of predicted toxin-antitoxin system
MKIIIDMNLSPAWVETLAAAAHDATHWSSVGAPGAKDHEILRWAKDHAAIVFTHDLDFGAILAATQAESPSVVQVRTNDPTPKHCGRLVTQVLERCVQSLNAGALLSIDEQRARIRLLPIGEKGD